MSLAEFQTYRDCEATAVRLPPDVYAQALARAGSHRAPALLLGAGALALEVRQAALRRPDTAEPGETATAWLRRRFGQDDDGLKRAVVAALALGLEDRAAEVFPASLQAHYGEVHDWLAASLRRERAYDPGLFSRDVALASALAAPTGALCLHAPDGSRPALGAALRARRAAAGFARHALQLGMGEARDWIEAAGMRPWAELHLEMRALEAFNAEGLVETYRLAADILRDRDDLAGVFGASWLYDPRLAAISPGLSFMRRTAEDGGARLVRLKVDPLQTAFATARSPTRRALVETGAWKPVCWGMYWTRADLLSWAGRRDAGQKQVKVNLK